ncbi:MAG: OsmC family protein [Flavobacterium sp.]|nr:OsmC family protein [Flavobacterium sp.]
MTSKITYLGNLRTESVHIQSGSKITTDAPLDNNGKGEAFSPTDLVANALGACMFTVMGIKAVAMKIDLSHSTATVTKIMGTEPRRIIEIQITFEMNIEADHKTKTILEKVAMTCPVHFSLHSDIKQTIRFNWKN